MKAILKLQQPDGTYNRLTVSVRLQHCAPLLAVLPFCEMEWGNFNKTAFERSFPSQTAAPAEGGRPSRCLLIGISLPREKAFDPMQKNLQFQHDTAKRVGSSAVK